MDGRARLGARRLVWDAAACGVLEPLLRSYGAVLAQADERALGEHDVIDLRVSK